MAARFQSWLAYSYDVPWCVPAWGWRELMVFLRCAAGGRVVQGPEPQRFAAALAGYLGVRHVLPVNLGRVALELALRAVGVREGDEVVVPSYVCRAVLHATRRAGARPVFADVGADLNVTEASIAAAITPRTRCVVVAHLFGQTAPIDRIEALCSERGLALVDDAAQALGARCGDRLVGTFGSCGIVACGPGKPLAGAGGGALVTNDAGLYRRARAISLGSERASAVLGRATAFWVCRRLRRYSLPVLVLWHKVVREREHDEADYPLATLSNLEAGMARAQLVALADNAERRRRHARSLLDGVPAWRAWSVTDMSPLSMVTKLVLVLPEEGPSPVDAIPILGAMGYEAQAGYIPCHCLAGGGDASLPMTDRLWRRVLCVPVDTPPAFGLARTARAAWKAA